MLVGRSCYASNQAPTPNEVFGSSLYSKLSKNMNRLRNIQMRLDMVRSDANLHVYIVRDWKVYLSITYRFEDGHDVLAKDLS